SPLGYADPVSGLLTYVSILQFEHSFGVAIADDGSDEGSDEGFPEGFPEPTPEEEALFERMEHYDELTPAEQKKLDDEMEAFLSSRVPEPSPEEKAFNERMEHYDELSPAEQEKLDDEMEAFFEEKYGEGVNFGGPELPDDVRKALRDFSGLGGVLRFD
ncbi:hypothetical protein, partial [Nocardioides sp. GCM10030258]|uniref:hypothetical protein n=1 Tax=unclassified Nocardioides TaxID=2615069 RepID=UPI0036130384